MRAATASVEGILCKYGSFGNVQDQSKQAHLERLFSKREIYFARAIELNDPFELRPRFKVSDSPDGLLIDTIATRLLEIGRAKSLPEALVFAQQYYDKNPGRLRDSKIDEALSCDLQKNLHGNVGVLCLSRVPDSIIMFSHYGASHTGYCLEFDGPTIAEQFGSPPPFDIEYGMNYPTINPLAGTTPEVANLMWQIKFVEWAYEKEVRIISDTSVSMRDDQPSGPGVKVYRKRALKSVVLGANVSSQNVERVRSWLSQRDDGLIKLFRATIHATQFRLAREEIAG